jgi:hypothetical protein
MPFILRGVSVLGIDSVNTPMALRQKVGMIGIRPAAPSRRHARP